MAASTEERDKSEEKEDTRFECNICFEPAKDAVVSMCGHLFCWPCIHTWMESRPNNTPTCPVCKSVIDKERLIPLYGRGSAEQKDPRDQVPPRPQGQREEAPNEEQQGFFGPEGFNMGGINVSFGLGTFPFAFGLGPTFTFQTGTRRGGGFHMGQQQNIRRPRQGAPGQTEEQRKMMARLMLTFAILFIVMIIFT